MNPIYIERIGADPEVFLATAKGEPHSAEGLIGGTKQAPKPMVGLPEGYFIQEDNVAAEFNIPACQTPTQFANSLQKALAYVRKVSKKHKLVPFLAPEADFPIPQVMTPHAMTLGCDPDFNAWTCEVNPRPQPPVTMRTAAAHIHISWGYPDDEQRWALIRALDVTVGLPSIIATPPNRRRQLYGKAGACRLKKYGVEYRTPDNFYLKDVPTSVKVGTAVFQTAERLNHSPLWYQQVLKKGDAIQAAINEHNQSLAEELVNFFDVKGF